MYKHLLLASDGTRESLVTLREGALIAKRFEATAHLLIIEPETASTRIAESHCAVERSAHSRELLDLGLSRLRQLGVKSTGELLRGEPVRLISERVGPLGIDLVVLGHRRQSFLDRWWSGANGGYIVDNVACSVLVVRDTISDEEFNCHLAAASAG